MAVRLRHVEIEGAPVPVAGGLAALTVWGLAVFTTGPHGAFLSMAAPEAPLSRLVWVGREQESTPLPLPARRYAGARLSPEGRSIATTIVDDDVGVWLAVKVLAPEVATMLGPERFLREIEIAARLTHPHILPLHDSGELAGFLFFVMPHVDGGSLRARLARHVRARHQEEGNSRRDQHGPHGVLPPVSGYVRSAACGLAPQGSSNLSSFRFSSR